MAIVRVHKLLAPGQWYLIYRQVAALGSGAVLNTMIDPEGILADAGISADDWLDVSQIDEVKIAAEADVASAANGMVLEQGVRDAVADDDTVLSTTADADLVRQQLAANTFFTAIYEPTGEVVRFTYTNGGTIWTAGGVSVWVRRR